MSGELRELIYVDSEKVTSLLSQLKQGLSASEVEKYEAREDEVGEALMRVSERVVRTREVRYFDHLVTEFMEVAQPPVLDGTDRRGVESAFTRGLIVRLEGQLQVNDYASIDAVFDRAEAVNTASLHAAQDATLKRNAEKSKAQFAKLRRELLPAIKAVFTSHVEFSLELSGGSFARGVVRRDMLRETPDVLALRYGAVSAARFNVIASVSDMPMPRKPAFGGPNMRQILAGFHEIIRGVRGEMGEAADEFVIVPIIAYRLLNTAVTESP